MSANRVLNEEEMTEQVRLSIKKELMAYIKDGVPRSAKIDDVIEMWKQINVELQLKQAARNSYTRILQMLTPKERTAELQKVKKYLLPESEQK